MDLLRCFVEGPTGTPYEGGLFILDLRLPAQYPAASPKAFYWAFGRYCNPNLYACGKVCLSLLGTWQGPGWTPESTLLQLIVSVQGLVLIEHPYCNEPGQERDAGSEHSVAYNMQTQADVAANMTQMCTTPPEGAAHIVAAFAARQGAALVARARDYANDRLGDSALASLDSAFGHPLGRPVFFKPGSAEADRSLLSFYRVTARDHHCEAEAEPRLVEYYRAAAATPDWCVITYLTPTAAHSVSPLEMRVTTLRVALG